MTGAVQGQTVTLAIDFVTLMQGLALADLVMGTALVEPTGLRRCGSHA